MMDQDLQLEVHRRVSDMMFSLLLCVVALFAAVLWGISVYVG